MEDEMFDELVESVKQAVAIRRGEMEAGRVFESADQAVDARQVRENLGLSQTGFAALLGISAGTLRNWEQGRRSPEGPAKILLRIAAQRPEVIWETVRPIDSSSSQPAMNDKHQAPQKVKSN